MKGSLIIIYNRVLLHGLKIYELRGHCDTNLYIIRLSSIGWNGPVITLGPVTSNVH